MSYLPSSLDTYLISLILSTYFGTIWGFFYGFYILTNEIEHISIQLELAILFKLPKNAITIYKACSFTFNWCLGSKKDLVLSTFIATCIEISR